MLFTQKKLKQVLNHRLTFKFNQIAWLKPYIDINTYLGKQKHIMTLRKTFSTW